jgi:hypothetical protein
VRCRRCETGIRGLILLVEVALEVRSSKPYLGGSNSMVESQPSKLLVAGPIPVSRSIFQ